MAPGQQSASALPHAEPSFASGFCSALARALLACSKHCSQLPRRQQCLLRPALQSTVEPKMQSQIQPSLQKRLAQHLHLHLQSTPIVVNGSLRYLGSHAAHWFTAVRITCWLATHGKGCSVVMKG